MDSSCNSSFYSFSEEKSDELEVRKEENLVQKVSLNPLTLSESPHDSGKTEEAIKEDKEKASVRIDRNNVVSVRSYQIPPSYPPLPQLPLSSPLKKIEKESRPRSETLETVVITASSSLSSSSEIFPHFCASLSPSRSSQSFSVSRSLEEEDGDCRSFSVQ